MNFNYKGWKNLFLFCSGLVLAATFCMKWLEAGFQVNGSPFTIIGLELGYPREKVVSILQNLDRHTASLLRYQLIFDFVFMLGVYPGIAALCLMGRLRSGRLWIKNLLVLLAFLQLLAWACDIYENCCLLKWIQSPGSVSGFSFYHIVVTLKWLFAIVGAIAGFSFAFRKSNKLDL